jgi:hypothetical protein
VKELIEYRKSLLDRLVQAAQEFRLACLAAKDAFASVNSDWNIHQLAVHTRDVHKLVYSSRARRTATEVNPEFQNFDGDAYMSEHYSADEPLDKILDELVRDVESLVQELREFPQEAWSRQSSHVRLGDGFTLQAWVERGLAHIEEHLRTAKRRD